MASRHNGGLNVQGMMNDYSQLRAVPAILGILFALASLYQFGAFSEFEIAWFDYAVSTQNAMLVSLIVLVIAFASSKTKDFERYESWEQALMGAAPVLILGTEYVGPIEDFVFHTDPWTQVLAFLICVSGYAVAMR